MENKKYIQLRFLDTVENQNELLIALLSGKGYYGFEEEEKALKAFIELESFNSDNLADVLKIIPASYSKTIIEEENWNAQWESSFEPIIVNDFAAIRAAFHQPVTGVKQEIIITPKMSFGTGHHATTYMMIEQMEALDFKGKTVVDFGTGTAVLAILAEKMGANSVDAIDNDEWSIENSLENVAANNCTKIKLIKDETVSTGSVYDIILANINLNVILNNLSSLKAAAKKGSFILLSGFIKADETVMMKNLAENSIQHVKTLQKGDWISLLAQMK